MGVYDGAWRIHRAVLYTLLWHAIHKKECTSVVIDNPSAAPSPSFPAHLCSPSLTLFFFLTASCNATLEQCCQGCKYNKQSGNEFERTRSYNGDTLQFTYIGSVLGRITGSFGVWLRVCSPLGVEDFHAYLWVDGCNFWESSLHSRGCRSCPWNLLQQLLWSCLYSFGIVDLVRGALAASDALWGWFPVLKSLSVIAFCRPTCWIQFQPSLGLISTWMQKQTLVKP